MNTSQYHLLDYQQDFDQLKKEYKNVIEQVKGWSGNFRGFIQYRKMFNNENVTK
jgi:hypothetical protein